MKTSSPNGGTGLLTLLTVLFVGLKLAGIAPVSEWSWWWVLAPTWIPLAIFIAVLAVGVAAIARQSK